MTHQELVSRAMHWTNKTLKMPVVLYDQDYGHEKPDVIGFSGWKCSVIECKRTRSDFFRDQDKPHVKWKISIGDTRWYFTPPKLVKIEELPEGYGLAECHDYQVRVIKKPTALKRTHYTLGAERNILFHALCRNADNIEKINEFIKNMWPLRGIVNTAVLCEGMMDTLSTDSEIVQSLLEKTNTPSIDNLPPS